MKTQQPALSGQNMPILEVEIVALDENPNLPAGLSQTLADVVAQIFNTPTGTVWVKLRVIPPTYYAEEWWET